MSQTRELIELLRAFIKLQSNQLQQGNVIMSGLTSLQAAVARLTTSVDNAIAVIGQGSPGEEATLNNIAGTLLSLAAELDDAAQPATSSATATASAPASSSSTATASSSASASAPASSSSTATAPGSPARPAARRRQAAPPAAGDGVFRG